MRISDLTFNDQYESVLLRYPDGDFALWITDRYASGEINNPQAKDRYRINDLGVGSNRRGSPIGSDEELDDIIRRWKLDVQWKYDLEEDWL